MKSMKKLVACRLMVQQDERTLSLVIARKTSVLLDPTIRFEINEQQPLEVCREKQNIYEPCCDHLGKQYNIRTWKVIGLMFGARRTISRNTLEILKNLKVSDKTIIAIVSSILKSSLSIISHHLYSL